jgi:hypothetical protein
MRGCVAGFQIASRSSTAISTCQPTPPPAVPLSMDPEVPAPGTLRFPRSWLAPLASAGPALPATCSAWEGRVLYWAACTRSASSASFSDHRRLLLILISAQPPPKNVSLRRSCGACLRRPCGAGVRPLKYPEVPRSRLRRAPPGPCGSMSLASPVRCARAPSSECRSVASARAYSADGLKKGRRAVVFSRSSWNGQMDKTQKKLGKKTRKESLQRGDYTGCNPQKLAARVVSRRIIAPCWVWGLYWRACVPI